MDRLKVLVVDDEQNAQAGQDFTVKSNFDVLEASDGEEALDIFIKKDIALISFWM